MTGAEEYNVMGFEFVEDVGFRVVIEGNSAALVNCGMIIKTVGL